MTEGITVNDNFIPCNPSKVSDGYHTFEELYDHRCLLFIQLIGLLPAFSFASYCHSDETVWEGWFIAGCRLNNGMITYHLPIKFADLIPNSVWVPKAPEWDGHTSRDVCDRLIKEAKNRKIAAPTFSPDGLYFLGPTYDAKWGIPETPIFAYGLI